MNVEDFPKISINNWSDINDDTECGCYFCLRTCKGSEIDEWGDEGTTALCPTCGLDTLIPNFTDQDVLAEGLERWFTESVDEPKP